MASRSSDDDIQACFEKLKRRDEERRGVRHRKMVDLDITEVSAVDHPASLVGGGWVVLKSADDGHRHRADVDYLAGMALGSARQLFDTDTIPPGGPERPIDPGDETRRFGRSSCGCLYFRSPESVEKAASDAYSIEVRKAAPKRTWTPSEAAYLTAATNKLLGREA